MRPGCNCTVGERVWFCAVGWSADNGEPPARECTVSDCSDAGGVDVDLTRNATAGSLSTGAGPPVDSQPQPVAVPVPALEMLMLTCCTPYEMSTMSCGLSGPTPSPGSPPQTKLAPYRALPSTQRNATRPAQRSPTRSLRTGWISAPNSEFSCGAQTSCGTTTCRLPDRAPACGMT